MPRINYNISLVGKTPEQVKDMINALKELGIANMGFGHNNSKAWIVWTKQDLSQLLSDSGFKFIDNLI
ncbi:MAG: hypothetical protein Q7K16_03820 [Candidatus Azambacteria bacterium]|nr:hypothetical protein [Candidatus Azambacteria bacterium]